MFKVEPNAIYTKDELQEFLRGYVHVETFIRKYSPRSVFKGVYLGADILESLRSGGQVNNGEGASGIDAGAFPRRARKRSREEIRQDMTKEVERNG